MLGPCGFEHGVEDTPAHSGPLAAYVVGVEAQHPVEPDLARSSLGVPGAGADVHPLAAVARLLGGVEVVVA